MDETMREIEELREENKRLREQLEKEKRKPVLPTEILERHEKLRGILYKAWMPWVPSKKQNDYDIDTGMQGNLSQLVRSVVFNETKADGKTKDRYVLCNDMTDEEYQIYSGTIDQVLTALEIGREAKKNGRTVEKEAEENLIRITECVFDMSTQAAVMLMEIPDCRKDDLDSRDLFQSVFSWAKEFEKSIAHEDEDYLEKIDDFGRKKLDEYFGMEE